MGILQWLQGSESDPPVAQGAGDTDTVRKIVSELEAMPRERARFVAAFAYILGRVAHADHHFSDEETTAMEEIVHRFGDLPEEQAVLVVQIAKSQNRLFGGTENFLVTREFREISSVDERRHLLDCMFAVSAADDSISTAEESQIRQIASELGFTHREYVQVRLAYSDQREVMKPFREEGPGS
ncbi:MAG: TerB family tellurite resistance protein [Thermoanaerobaculia bacterium]